MQRSFADSLTIASGMHRADDGRMPADDSMDDLAQPATRRDLRELATATRRDMAELGTAIRRDMAERFATRQDLERFATRQDLERFATRQDLEQFATRQDLAALDSKFDARFGELRRHMDVSVEALRADIRNLIDFVTANINGLAHRLDAVEDGHGRRLSSLELRTTRLERRKK